MTLRPFLLSSALVLSSSLCNAAPGAAATPDVSSQENKAVPVDNTAINKRDRNFHQVTADQQTSGTQDTEITREIRRAVIKNHQLSVYAHNVKIITIGGKVTLKGPVRTAQEKTAVESLARSTPGVSDVKSQISIKR